MRPISWQRFKHCLDPKLSGRYRSLGVTFCLATFNTWLLPFRQIMNSDYACSATRHSSIIRAAVVVIASLASIGVRPDEPLRSVASANAACGCSSERRSSVLVLATTSEAEYSTCKFWARHQSPENQAWSSERILAEFRCTQGKAKLHLCELSLKCTCCFVIELV